MAASEERNMEAAAVGFEQNIPGQAGVPAVFETTRVRAARLLDAWIAGDRQRLNFELSHWREGDLAMNDEGHGGRGELLLCVVRQMMDEPDLYASRTEKLHLGVWLDLLSHLSES
jgi:hypothetical protein